MNRITNILAYIIVFILILCSFSLYYQKRLPTSKLSLVTNSVLHLHPHGHSHTDSVLDNSHHVMLASEPVIVEDDVWVKGFSFEIKNADNTVLHHAVLALPNKADLHCPNRMGYHLISFGQDPIYNPHILLPEGYAVLIPKGSKILFYSMLHNPMPPLGYGKEYYNVSTEIQLDVASNEEIPTLKQAEFIRLDLTDKPCDPSDEGYVFTVPANTPEFTFGSSTENLVGSSYTFNDPGKIIYMGGHLHGWEGGKYLSIYLNGKLVKKLMTTKSTNDPYTYDTTHEEENIQIQKGDTIRITATYENKDEEVLSGAMGMVGFYFAKE